MKRSLGNKRNELGPEHIAEVTHLYESFTEGNLSKIFPNEFFAYKKITVDRPLRVRFDVTHEALATIGDLKALSNLDYQIGSALMDGLRGLCGESFQSRAELDEALAAIFKKAGKVPSPVRKAVITAMMVRDPTAQAVGGEPDPMLRDTENVPVAEDVNAFVNREVRPFAPDVWVDETKTKIGYEIPFTRQFYRYVAPRALEDIDSEIKASERRILALLSEVTE